jgi:hypothetical protein
MAVVAASHLTRWNLQATPVPWRSARPSLTRCRFSVLQDGSGSALRRMDARPQRGRMRLKHGWPALIEWLAIAATMGLGAAYSCDPDPQSDLDGRLCAQEDTRLDRGDPLPRWSGHLCCLEHQTRDAALPYSAALSGRPNDLLPLRGHGLGLREPHRAALGRRSCLRLRRRRRAAVYLSRAAIARW